MYPVACSLSSLKASAYLPTVSISAILSCPVSSALNRLEVAGMADTMRTDQEKMREENTIIAQDDLKKFSNE